MGKIKKRWVFHDGYIAEQDQADSIALDSTADARGTGMSQAGCQGRWKTSDLGVQLCPHCGDMVKPTVLKPLEE
jgi:hypothetical protein